jgi:uncharacterized BrkB/YihY/UPF0761 family membrane protein
MMPLRNAHVTNLLKIIKILKTFAFWFCTLWVLLGKRRQVQVAWRQRQQKEDWMKRFIVLATMVALVAMLALAPMALAQGSTMMSPMATGSPTAGAVPESGGPAILLPAAALLLGSGILTYAILRRR